MITIIVLWILLGIIAVIVILLHFSITAQIDLNKKGFDLRVRYMFFDIYPRKPKKKKQKRSKKAELPEDSFDDFEEFEDNIEESLPIPQTDDTPDKTGEVSEQIVEAKPEKIEKNEADENVSVSEVEDKQEDISDIDTDTNVEASAENKPEKITVKQEKKGFVGKLFHKKDKGEKKPVSKSKKKKKSKFYELKAQYKIQQFVFFASFGMNNTIIPVVSYNYGKGDKARVRSGIKYGMLYTLGLMLLGIIGLQLFASQICHVFSLSADTEIFATYAIRIITLGYLFAGANIAYQGIFQALDHGIASLVLSLIRLLVIPLPAAYLLTLTSSAGKIVWAAVPFGELVGTVAAIVIMGRIKREIKLKD